MAASDTPQTIVAPSSRASRAAKPRSYRGWLVALVVLLDLAAILIGGQTIEQGKLEHLKKDRQELMDFGAVFENDVSSALNRTEVSLLSIADEISRQLRAGRLDERQLGQYILRQVPRQTLASNLVVSDAEGNLRWGALGKPVPNIQISDRPFFQELRRSDKEQVIGSDILLTRLTGEPSIALSCRYVRADGRFGGVVVARIRLEDIGSVLSNTSQARWIRARLLDRSIATQTPNAAFRGDAIPLSALKNSLVTNPNQGFLQGPEVDPSTNRMIAYRRLTHYPYYVVLQRDLTDTLAQWQSESGRVTALVFTFIGVSLTVALFLIRDLRQIERTQRQRTEAVNRLAQLAAQVPGMLFQMHRTRTGKLSLTFLSDTVRTLYGISAEEVIADPATLVARVDPKAFPEALAVIRESAHSLKPWLLEYRVRDITGAWSWRRTIAAPQDIGQGEVLWHGFSSDLSAERRATREREVLIAQLHQAQKLEALGRLVGGIAHDFNNVLAAILGFGRLATQCEGTRSDERLQGYLSQITAAGERARELVASLLDQGRSRPAGSAPAIMVAPLLTEVIAMLRPTVDPRIEIVTRIPVSSSRVRILGVELQQVVMNLLLNACDAVQGDGRVEIALESPAPDGDAFEAITVHDDGHGIAPEDLERIFDPFFTTKGSDQGTGLGLAVVHDIVTRLGGRITVSSSPGTGTTFRVLLPLERNTPEAENVAVPRQSPWAPIDRRPAIQSPQRAWIVDDSPPVVAWLSEALTQEGFEVESWHDPVALLSAFRDQPSRPDVVISDLTMPHMSGLELAQELTRSRPDLPVIICTGYSDTLPALGRPPSAVWAVLDKPVPIDRLVDTIDAAILERESQFDTPDAQIA